MKKYTHAWLAMMAMKRIEKAAIPSLYKHDAKELITWFKDFRDFVISGAWYPDSVFKDMSTSHILKYTPDPKSADMSFRRMPATLQTYNFCKEDELARTPFRIKSGNICDRCESFTESLIDSFKILESEGKGVPIVPSCNHTAMRFFILSHYIADCHMPLHCDARSLSAVHTFIEEEWDKQVRESYELDEANERFFYDPDGYPLKKNITPLMEKVEKELESREFYWDWGPDCKNTWDYMSGISQYSYLMAYKLVPADKAASDITKAWYSGTDAFTQHFEEYSWMIFTDAIESIAKIWLHAWVRYKCWQRGCELATLRAEESDAEKAWSTAIKIVDTYPDKIEELTAGLAGKKGKNLENAKAKIATLQEELTEAANTVDNLYTLYFAASLKTEAKTEEYSKYGTNY